MSEKSNEGESYCLDICFGHDEASRKEMIGLLMQIGKFFGVTKGQRGSFGGHKILRIQTPKARELAEEILKTVRNADDFTYDIHETFDDANRSETWLPDYDSPDGYKLFDFPQPQGEVV